MDEDEEGSEAYEFVTTGERTCERCMALAGSRWQTPPDPPHAHCECEVVPLLTGVHIPRDCGDNTWSMEQLPDGVVHYGPAVDYGWEWGYKVTIDCWDGGVYEFEMWVDMGKDSDWPGGTDAFDDMDAFAWSELYDQAEAVAAQVCSPCEAPLVS